MPKFQNMRQDPVYIDVEANRMIIYEPQTRPFEVLARELLLPGNDFDAFLDWIEPRKATRYVVLLLRPGSAKFQNMRQDPVYVDVEANRMIIYEPQSRPFEVLARELLLPGNDFEAFLDWLEPRKATRYVVLLLRPGSAKFQRRLRQICRERGVDVGFEPWDAGRTIEIAGAAQGALRIRPARTTLEAQGIDPDMFWQLQDVEGAVAPGTNPDEYDLGDDLDEAVPVSTQSGAPAGEGA
jgi:hypothetical protein